VAAAANMVAGIVAVVAVYWRGEQAVAAPATE
jgi:hypothetical protein